MEEKNIPEKPMMLYDGDCGFCSRWIKRWERLTGNVVHYAPYKEAGRSFPKVSKEECKQAIQFIMLDGSVTSGAHAVFKALSMAGKYRSLHWLYDHMPFFGRITETAYQWIAHHRLLLSKLFYGSINKCG